MIFVGVELRGIEDSADFCHVIDAHSTHVPVKRDTELHTLNTRARVCGTVK